MYPDDMINQLSTETIYAALYVLPPRYIAQRTVGGAASGAKARRPRARGTDRVSGNEVVLIEESCKKIPSLTWK